MFSNVFEHLVVEIMWKNPVKIDILQKKIWSMHIACEIPKAKNTYSEYVIFIAFPLQQWFHERSSILRYSILNVMLLKVTRLDENVTYKG
jgi:hypothetical protein